MFADLDVTDDPFWRARTEDANGRVYASSRLEDVGAWRARRLSVDIADLFFRRAGLMPHPHEDGFTVRSCSCALSDRVAGRFGGEVPPAADGASWPEFVRIVCADLNLIEVAEQGDHRRCRHTQPQSLLPLMWQVALMIGDGVRVVPAPAENQLLGAFDRESTWIEADKTLLSPSGRAYFDNGGVLDLAAMNTDGFSAGEMAAAVGRSTDRMADIAGRAGIAVPPRDLEDAVPPWMFAYRDDETLVIGVPRGVRQDGVDLALAYGLGYLEDRDLHLILPAGTESPTGRRAAFVTPRVRVWIHDGYRVTAAPIPARDEIFAAARKESWRLDREARDTIRDGQRGRAMADLDGLEWRWMGQVARTSESGRRTVDLARGKGPALHVVVDASDPDDMTVLHALDQWIWATANLGELRSTLVDIPAHDWVMLTFVVGSPDGVPAVQRWTDVLLERINYGLVHSEVVRIFRYAADDPEFDVEMTSPLSTSPVLGPRPGPRWPAQLQNHLAAAANGWFWSTPEMAIIDSAEPALRGLKPRGVRLNTRHVAAAQAFAINLFGPLDEAGVAAIFEARGIPVASAERPHLAWTDPHDRLGEASQAGAERTAVDVLLKGVTADRAEVAILVCVNLTEEDFAECDHHQHPANPRREVCRTEAPFGGDPAGCFQVRRRDAEHIAPRYAEVIDLTAVPHADGGCPFRVANEQMRYMALAAALHESGDFADVRVVLCAPLGHDAAWRRLKERAASVRAVGIPPLGDLPADLVLLLGAHPEADLMRERYGLMQMVKVDADR